MKIGSHVSMSGGLIGAAKEAYSYGANTFMIYTGAPQNTIRKPISDLKIDEGLIFMKEHDISDIVVHAPYIINLASFKPQIFDLAVTFLAKEIERAKAVKSNYLVLHPGSYTEMDSAYGISRIVEGLNEVLTRDLGIYICLETMSGKGSEIGRTFEELANIIEKVKYNENIGICFDTCHTHDSGYDIINDFDGVINNFDKIIGVDRIKTFHINGSLNPRGSSKDRHANIGAGVNNPKGKDYLGKDAILRITHHSVVGEKTLILETPWIDDKTNLYKQEIEVIRNGI
ncbi:MAG TPA: deoxyribonuclease IV [Clostridiales bacterium]|nr:MAG: deoxyribonuclease IV [Clostridiales bacterium GWD2_32_59]HAN09560.1 deoxyribonuclease IV [Clostridiales bacterium]